MMSVASIYGKVSSDYIMTPLSEWSRISNTEEKSKDDIEGDSENLLKLCMEAESDIKKVLEIEDETILAERKKIGEQWNRNEL